jgi:hypothetical protein
MRGFCSHYNGPQVSDAFISSFFEMAVIPMVGNDYEVRPHHHLFVYGVLHRYCGRLQRCPVPSGTVLTAAWQSVAVAAVRRCNALLHQ